MRPGAGGASDQRWASEREEQRLHQETIERRLLDAGLRRVSLDRTPRFREPRVQNRLANFRPQLRSLGPLFREFGRYLGSRLDLLEGADAREFAMLPEEAEPISEDEVRRLLRAELGGPLAASFAQLDGAAISSLALSQTHQGYLTDGRRVRVKIARTSASLNKDLAVLPHLPLYLSSLGWPLSSARRLVKDFEDFVARRLDLGREAEALRRFAALPDEPRLLAPRVVDILSSSRVLTIEAPRGALLFPPSSAPERTGVETLGAARILTDLWMRLVFDEFQIPEAWSRGEVRSTRQGGVEISGGLFHPISSNEADALWSYVAAAAHEDPDEVFYALKRLTSDTTDAQAEALHHHLGHVVPRRDGRFAETPPGFPEFLLSHWLQLERHSLVPSPALVAFYRGLVSLRDLAGPGLSHHVLREAAQVVQIARGRKRVLKSLDPKLLSRGAESAARMLMELPRNLERSRRSQRLERENPLNAESQRPGLGFDGWTGLAVGLLLAATMLIWFLRFPTALGRFTDVAQAITLAALGLGLLRAVWKG